ncbi:MAG TPA: prenyltransferase/squalene oxidase repeat-containing protein, partial [bacterium]
MKKISVLVILACLLWTIPCHAQSLSLSNGATWLSANQNADGSWGAQADLSLVYSVEAVSALQSSGTATTNYSAGITWLAAQDATSTDELSRKIYSLVNASIDSSTFINTLLSYKNSDGGWSYQNSPVSDPFDSALALQALKAANYSDTTVLYQAINFLTSNQNPDGGWGFRPTNSAIEGDASNTYVTAVALRALTAFNSIFNVQ